MDFSPTAPFLFSELITSPVPFHLPAMSELDRKDSCFTETELGYPPSLSKKQPIPLPKTITLPPDTGLPLSRQRHLSLQRTHSLGLTTGPSRADGPSRVVGEFRCAYSNNSLAGSTLTATWTGLFRFRSRTPTLPASKTV
jgi:hypothetical protein